MEKHTIGGFISALRKSAGMTQKELAEKLNVSDKAVSRWENSESYPDLMLIPVIAEIFGVSADELLRGERKRDETKLCESSEKNVELLLRHTLSSYRSKTVISLGTAFFGLALAFAVNFAALRSILAFWLAVIMFVVSAVCHTFFSNQAFSAVASHGENAELLSRYKRKLTDQTVLVYTVIASLLLFCLPLAFAGDAYAGLDFMSWFYPGGAVTLVFGLIVTVISSVSVLKSKEGVFSPKQKHNAKSKIKIIAVWSVAVLLSIVSMLVLNNDFMYVEGTELRSPEELCEFMESYKSDQSIIEYIEGDGYEDIVHDFDGNILFSYPHNEYVPVVSFNKKNDGKTVESFFPCRVYTQQDREKRGTIVDTINIEGEGKKLVKKAAIHLIKSGKAFHIVKLVWQSAFKYMGFRLGRKYRKLSYARIHRYTMNKTFVEKNLRSHRPKK